MKSSIRKSTFKAIYRLLDKVSPVPYDCGTLCGAACCTCGDSPAAAGDDFQFGIYLLPGEDKLFTMKEDWLIWSAEQAEDFDFPESWFGKVYFVRCKTPPVCPREMRPLQCRFFPLTPHLTEDGRLQLILSPSVLPYQCPLIRERIPLTREFIQATYTVWKHLLRDPLIYDLVELDSQDRIDEEIPLTVIR